MNSNLSTEPNANEPPGDKSVDRLLGDYFKSRLPKKWPKTPQPWSASQPAESAESRSSRQGRRSRWALAASVALLVGACWYLSGQITDGKGKRGIGLEDGTAKLPKELVKPEPKVGMP